ncbi:uncharacterized protein LOC109862417 [Pseudomyrmex gracilis]|uniref:uncharacterized protein LOC109862417 n=1 Tax=Pseudomyrmex gracilis TaxID=219809 RepID=UPI0009953535|nr:uncharacterized protein LOC109862417 [Pseudomyrmex gracilis]
MGNKRTFEHLRICHINCQSLVAHFDEFGIFFCNSHYHIIFLSEIWLKPEISDNFVGLQDYSLYRCDRTGRGGGGVAFYLHNNFRAHILKTSDNLYCRKPEYIIAEIFLSDVANLLLAVVYRPPNCGYLQEFEDAFLNLLAHYRHSVILGDFNADLLVLSYDSTHLLTFIESAGLYLVPYQPTHNLAHSCTLLDLCIIDDSEKLIKYRQHAMPFLSAHDLIYIDYNICAERIQERIVTFRSFKDFNEIAFVGDLESVGWSGLLTSFSLDEKIDIFNQTVLYYVDKHAPLRSGAFRSLLAPWLTSEIKSAVKNRDRARRRWRRDRRVESYIFFKKLRNDVQNVIRAAKNKYYLAFFSKTKDSGTIWTELRRLGLIKVKKVVVFPIPSRN